MINMIILVSKAYFYDVVRSVCEVRIAVRKVFDTDQFELIAMP